MTIDEKGRAAAIEALEPRCRAITGGANPLARRLAEELADVVLEAYESAKQKEAEGWREDVAEMPDAGERFLAEDQYGDWITVRRFDPGKPKDYSANAVINGRTGRWWYPQRWRPLPEPPSALLSAGGEG